MGNSTKICLLFFGLYSIFDLIAVFFDFVILEQITKPFIILSLLAFFLSVAQGMKSSLKTYIILALIFSFFGDSLLLLNDFGSAFFLLGLSAFLIAHIFYIVSFNEIRNRNQEKFRPIGISIAFVILYLSIFFYILLPKVDNALLVPIILYGTTIGLMFISASTLSKTFRSSNFRMLMLGAGLFILSDSLIALNKFVVSFDLAHPLIMLTYILAQWLIVRSLSNYMNISIRK